jgi:sortase A
MNNSKLKTVNSVLISLILIINSYIIFAPFWPQITYQLETRLSKQTAFSSYSEIDRSYNHLVIPHLNLDQPVLVGEDPLLVNKGIWHRPASSTPEKGSNTVLAGHRYTYRDSAVFYHLDKLRQNNEIILVWDKKIYVYQVNNVEVVSPNTPSVETESKDSKLTLYTCTPLWSAENRLVINSTLKDTL